jgi:inorganic pyrophosphatase
MIDDGELDWKIIAIDSKDPLASKLNDINDVEVNLPGTVSGMAHDIMLLQLITKGLFL